MHKLTAHALPAPLCKGLTENTQLAHLREDVNSEKEAQPVSLVGIGSSVLQTADPTESKGVPWAVSIGTSKLADQLAAEMRGGLSLGAFSH